MGNTKTLFCGEMFAINFKSTINLQNNVMSSIESKNKSKKILQLFKYLSYYNFVLKLYEIKYHHINVGYCNMTYEELHIKKQNIINRKNNIEKQIKTLYYDNRS